MARYIATSKGVIPYTAEEEAAANAHQAEWEAGADDRAAEAVRTERNELLTQTDWTQVPDAPVDAEAWATYRQALRDITAQEGFPNDVTFPTKPE